MSEHGWRPHIESALALSVARLLKTGALRVGSITSGVWQWGEGREAVARIGYDATMGFESGELRLSYRWTSGGRPHDVICTVRLSSLPLHYGGRRWYMHCPYTDRRALKLYKFDGIEQFCCRTAIRPLPTYDSQRTSGVSRIIAQRWALRRRLGDTFSDLFGAPCRPKRMRWRTFIRYAARDIELAEHENGCFLRVLERFQRLE